MVNYLPTVGQNCRHAVVHKSHSDVQRSRVLWSAPPPLSCPSHLSLFSITTRESISEAFPHNNVATSHVSVGRNLLKFVPTIFTLFLAFRPTHQISWSLNNSQINELSLVNRALACYHTPLIFAINVGIQHLPNIT